MPRATLLLLGVTLLLGPTGAFVLPCRSSSSSSRKRQQPHTILASSATATPPPAANKKALSPAQATKQFREELLTLVSMPEEDKEGREEAIAQRIDFVLTQLSELYVPPQTLPYMNLLLQGSWINIYNSWTVRRKMAEDRAEFLEDEDDEEDDEDNFLDLLGEVEEQDLAAGAALAAGPIRKQPSCVVELRGFRQALSPNLTTGGLVNTVQWECTAGKDGDEGLTGALIVRSRFDVNSRGMLEVGEVEHDLRMKRAPRHPDALIRAVQRVVPFDVFDPNGTFVQTAFMDHELRATQTHSTRFGTITSVYARNGTELATRLVPTKR